MTVFIKSSGKPSLLHIQGGVLQKENIVYILPINCVLPYSCHLLDKTKKVYLHAQLSLIS